MDWFKRASGVKIFITIWLLVAIFPLWRLRAVRQWQNDQINALEMQTKLGLWLSNSQQRDLIRQFPDDPAIQVLPFNAPNFAVTDLASPSAADWQKVTDDYFGRFDALNQRFPNELFLQSKWLRDATQGEIVIENDALYATYKLPPQPRPRTSIFSIKTRQRAVQIARKGAQVEPDNAFWPWMEAIFNFSLRRDEAALLALQKAGQCTRFDDGVSETTRRAIALTRRLQTVDFDDELLKAWSALLPHFGRMNVAARAAMWQANEAIRRGDTVRALEIAEIVQRAATPIARSRGLLITRLVGEALCYLVWRQTLEYAGLKLTPRLSESDFRAANSQEFQAQRRELAQRFAAYTRDENRADLGQSALELQASFTGQQLAARLENPRSDGLPQVTQSLARLHWLSSWLLRLALSGAVVWFAGLLMSRRAAGLPAQRTASLLSAAFCVGVTAAVLWGALRLGAVNMNSPFFNGLDNQPPNLATPLILIFAAVWLGPLLWTLFRSSLTYLRFGGQIRSTSWQWLTQFSLDMAALGSFIIVFASLSNPPGDTVSSQLWPAPLIIFIALFLSACFLHARRAPASLRIGILLWESALVCWMLWGYLNAYSRDGATDITIASISDQTTSFVLIAALILAVLGMVSWLRAVEWESASRHSFFSNLGAKMRLSAATLALWSSIAYLGVAVWAWPIRNHAQQILDFQLTQGEVAFIEAQSAKIQK